MSANNNEPPVTDRHKPDDIKVGQLYTFVVLRFPYRLFNGNGHGAYIMPGEPFLVIETGHRFDRCTNMLLVCNARGELGLADSWNIAPFNAASSQI
jgi:hypothetical protein